MTIPNVSVNAHGFELGSAVRADFYIAPDTGDCRLVGLSINGRTRVSGDAAAAILGPHTLAWLEEIAVAEWSLGSSREAAE